MALVNSNEYKPLRNIREFDDNGTRLLYLVARATLTEAQYKDIVDYLGVNGPGFQALCIDGSYFLACDGDPAKVKAEVLVRLAEKTAVEEEVTLTDAEKLALDKGLIEGGTFVIPLASQTDQTVKTAWVQTAVTALIKNGTTAVVTFSTGYGVALTLNDATGTATIVVTEEEEEGA